MAAVQRLPLRAFSPNNFQAISRRNIKPKQRPVSTCLDFSYQEHDTDYGFSAVKQSVSSVNITTIKETTFYNGEIFSVNIDKQRVRSTTAQHERSRSSQRLNRSAINKENRIYANSSMTVFEDTSRTRNVRRDLNSSAVSCSKDNFKSHRVNQNARSCDVAPNGQNTLTDFMPVFKPWSPPPKDLYEKDWDSMSNVSSNTFSAKKRDRRQKRRSRRNEQRDNSMKNWDATSIDSGHGSEISCSDFTDITQNRSRIRVNPDSSNRVQIIHRGRTPSPVGISQDNIRSRSMDSLHQNVSTPLRRTITTGDLDITLTQGNMSIMNTPGKMDNTYTSLVGVRDTPPVVQPPALPRRDIQHIKMVVPTLKRSPRVNPGSNRPVIRTRKHSSDSIKRALDLSGSDVTSKSVIVSSKFHKYTIDDIVDSYCNLVRDIAPDSSFPQDIPKMHDLSVDSGHCSEGQFSPNSIGSLNETTVNSIHRDVRPKAVVKPRTVSNSSLRHTLRDFYPLDAIVEKQVDVESEVTFYRNVQAGEFYC